MSCSFQFTGQGNDHVFGKKLTSESRDFEELPTNAMLAMLAEKETASVATLEAHLSALDATLGRKRLAYGACRDHMLI